MTKNIKTLLCCISICLITACADNELSEVPQYTNFPFQLVLDADSGGDLPDAEDYGLEVAFADYTGSIPANTTVTIAYEITNLSGDMIDQVFIDEVIYEADDEEYTLAFSPAANGLSGTITLNDPVSGVIPDEFEIIFHLPGLANTQGGFTFTLTSITATGDANIVLGIPSTFEYEVVDHELAGTWVYSIDTEESFTRFQEVFGKINHDLQQLTFADVLPGEAIIVEVEFEFEEVNITIIYLDTDGEEQEIEIEGEYDFEDGEMEIEGSYLIIGDDGEIEGELDFILSLEYAVDEINQLLSLIAFSIIDEDNYEEGEELFFSNEGITFELEKD